MLLTSVSKNKVVTIKLGGSAMDETSVIHQLAQDISVLKKDSMDFIVVHGGGKGITREMEARRVKPKKIAGLRVTDDATMSIVESVMKKINAQICNIFESNRVAVKPVIGSDGLLICEKLPPAVSVESGKEKKIDLGRVGIVTKVVEEYLLDAIENDIVPIVAPYGRGYDGVTLNVNADSAAGSIAGVSSDEFILLTDVDGIIVGSAAGQKIAEILTISEISNLKKEGVIRDGMIPKAEACIHAIESGVKSARIVNGLNSHPLLRIFKEKDVGTRILR